MLLEHERNFDLGMDALVTVRSWMLLEHERNCGLGMDAAGRLMLLEHEWKYGLGMDALMLLEHERAYGLGMDAAGPRMLLEHKRNYGMGMDAAGPRMLLEHERKMVWACCGAQGRTKWEDRKRGMPRDHIEMRAGCRLQMWSVRPRESRERFSRRIVEVCACRGTSDHAQYSARQLVARLSPKHLNP